MRKQKKNKIFIGKIIINLYLDNNNININPKSNIIIEQKNQQRFQKRKLEMTRQPRKQMRPTI